jgi:hypothetical protein
MLLALLNSLFSLLLDLLLVRCRSEASFQSEILLFRHQLRVLQRQTRRPRWQPGDRLLLAALSRRLARPAWCAVTPCRVISLPAVAALGPDFAGPQRTQPFGAFSA